MKVTLSPKQYEVLPMRHSMKSKALTKGDIMGFLEDKGVDNVAFLKEKGTGEDVVAFQIDFQPMRLEGGGSKTVAARKFNIKFIVPNIWREVGKRKKLEYCEKESWRILYWHLVNKLTALEYGVDGFAEAFAPYITIQLTNDSSVTVADILRKEIIEGDMRRLTRLALEDQSSQPRRFVESTTEEKKGGEG